MSVPPSSDRATLRRQLLATRQSWADTPDAAQAQLALHDRLLTILGQLEPDCLGLYWPMKGEFNPRPLALEAVKQWGCRLALPFARREPVDMHFRAWDGTEPTEQDDCRILTASGRPVEPDVVLVPCLGFTAQAWRLGYGGGYFDRYLAKHPDTTAIGVAWEAGQLTTAQLAPQEHDKPLIAVVTEKQTFSE